MKDGTSNRPWRVLYDSTAESFLSKDKKRVHVQWPWTIVNYKDECIARFENNYDAELVVKAVNAYDMLTELTNILNLAHKTTLA